MSYEFKVANIESYDAEFNKDVMKIEDHYIKTVARLIWYSKNRGNKYIMIPEFIDKIILDEFVKQEILEKCEMSISYEEKINNDIGLKTSGLYKILEAEKN